MYTKIRTTQPNSPLELNKAHPAARFILRYSLPGYDKTSNYIISPTGPRGVLNFELTSSQETRAGYLLTNLYRTPAAPYVGNRVFIEVGMTPSTWASIS